MERIKKLFKGKEEKEEEKEAAEEVAEVTEEPVAEVEETPEIEPVETAVEPRPTPPPEVEEAVPEAEVSVTVGGTMPYHSTFQDRLNYMFADAQIGAGIEAPDSFMLEFMAEGERFYIAKPSMG